MILFSNAKINIGLNVLRKRNDNYHDIETFFYPIQLCDILEINQSDSIEFTQTGLDTGSNMHNNLVMKAYDLLSYNHKLPAVSIHLHKQVPIGAGLGGGSSNAAFTLRGLNTLFSLGLSTHDLLQYASQLGSDCPFFIHNTPSFASGRGENLSSSTLSLKGYWLILVKPGVFVSTAEAYQNIKPIVPPVSLNKLIGSLSPDNWIEDIKNDFEESVFPLYPEICKIKNMLYESGAVYSSMSGSGSSVFGIFKDTPAIPESLLGDYFFHIEQCVY